MKLKRSYGFLRVACYEFAMKSSSFEHVEKELPVEINEGTNKPGTFVSVERNDRRFFGKPPKFLVSPTVVYIAFHRKFYAIHRPI